VKEHHTDRLKGCRSKTAPSNLWVPNRSSTLMTCVVA